MGRVAKNKVSDIDQQTPGAEDNAAQEPTPKEDCKKTKEEIPANVLELMRLYPQYERIWVTSRGFVHPDGAPKYLVHDAKIYNNKYYKK